MNPRGHAPLPAVTGSDAIATDAQAGCEYDAAGHTDKRQNRRHAMKHWNAATRYTGRILLALLLACTNGAFAGDAVDVRVSASVLAVCKIQSVRDIQFGTLDPSQATNTFAEGAVAFMCTRGVDYRLVVDKGQNYDAGAALRRMKSGDGSFLPYQLGAESFSGTGTGFRSAINIPLSASIRGSDYIDLPAVAFSDVIRLVLEP